MRRRGLRVVCSLAAGLLAACGRGPEQTEALPDQPVVLPRPKPPAAPPAEATPPAAAAPADITFDEVAKTVSATVSYSSAQGVLKVEDPAGTMMYQMSVVRDGASPAEVRELEESVRGPLRYPAERVQKLTGAFVYDLAEGGNRLCSLTYETSDDAATVADHYRTSIGNASAHPNLVEVPYGDAELVAFHTGLGTKRYRVVIVPVEGGTRIRVSQIEIAGAETQPWPNGQGLLAEAKAPAPAADEEEPPADPAPAAGT